jgi:hypothetical protein
MVFESFCRFAIVFESFTLDTIVFKMLIYYIMCNKNNKASSRAIIVSCTSIIIKRFLSLSTNIATIL